MGKILSPEEIEQLRREAELEKQTQDDSQVDVPGAVKLAMLISLAVGMIGGIAAAVLGAEAVAGFFAVQTFAVFGFGFFIGSLRMDIRHKISGFSFPLFVLVGAAAVLLGFLALIMRKRDLITEDTYLLIKGILTKCAVITGGLLQLLPTLYYRIMLKKRCIEPVSAVCSGHHILKVRDGEGDVSFIAAPIWTFDYDGGERTVIDNIYPKQKELPKIDEADEILVDPEHPDRIVSRLGLPRFGFKAIVGIALIAAGIWFC